MIEFIKDNFLYLTGIITALKWVYEYSQKLRWDKSKFLLERLEDFLSRPSTEKVNMLLDWNKFTLEIDGKEYRMDDEILLGALATHDKKQHFTELELKLRGLLDEYFDGLTEFLLLAECGLINKRDFRKFMSYWLKILNGEGERKAEPVNRQIKEYMLFYGFDKLHCFVENKRFFQ